MNLKTVGFAIATVGVWLVPAQGHHSFTMFDQERTVTVSGTLKEFEYSNPHCWLNIRAVDPKTGRNVDWAFEMGSTSQIAAQGWKSDSVKPGDKITVIAHPLKDGSRGGQYLFASFGDGRILQRPDFTPPK